MTGIEPPKGRFAGQSLPLHGRRVVLGVSGSIAAVKSYEIARRFEELGATVDVLLTPDATRFTPEFTFQNLIHGSVVADMWDPSEGAEIHIDFAREADVFVVAPATATTIAKLALGIADNIVALTALAMNSPIVIAPAMDAQMYSNTVVQSHIEALEARGVTVIGPESGRLASGSSGVGRLTDPIEIVAVTRGLLGKVDGDLRGRRLLITAGGTREAIDPVRFIGNHSSGRMGFALVEAARDRGADPILISTQDPPAGLYGLEIVRVESALEMHKAVKQRLSEIDVLVMAAAVADYQPISPDDHKLRKHSDRGFVLEMEQTRDILKDVNGKFIKIGFAAETNNLIENAQAKLQAKKLDLIVANDVGAPNSVFGSKMNTVTLIARNGSAEKLPPLEKYTVAHQVLDRAVVLLEQ